MSFAGSPPVVRHFLVCQRVRYDLDSPEAPYSLLGLLTAIGPEPGTGYPLLHTELWLFAQFQGDAGEDDVWIELVAVDDEGEATAEETTFGPWRLRMPTEGVVESRAFRLLNVPFATPGVYEFRLRCGPDVLAREPLLLLEV